MASCSFLRAMRTVVSRAKPKGGQWRWRAGRLTWESTIAGGKVQRWELAAVGGRENLRLLTSTGKEWRFKGRSKRSRTA